MHRQCKGKLVKAEDCGLGSAGKVSAASELQILDIPVMKVSTK